MEIAALALQQVMAQNNAALSMVKNAAQAEQSLVNVLAQQSAPSGGRGQIIDVTA